MGDFFSTDNELIGQLRGEEILPRNAQKFPVSFHFNWNICYLKPVLINLQVQNILNYFFLLPIV